MNFRDYLTEKVLTTGDINKDGKYKLNYPDKNKGKIVKILDIEFGTGDIEVEFKNGSRDKYHVSSLIRVK